MNIHIEKIGDCPFTRLLEETTYDPFRHIIRSYTTPLSWSEFVYKNICHPGYTVTALSSSTT